ncbi:MAG: DUF3179 domain-containing protein [Arenicellales bacterium]
MKMNKTKTSFGLSVALLISLAMFSASISANPFLKPKWPNTDFDKFTVDINEVMSGGPPRDGIPSIDDPKFDDVTQAAEWLDPREPVIRVVIDNEARAYPLQLLIYHEIVNDQIGDTPISVTFCPLCNSSVVFDRRFDGKILDFGTTGLLRKSDMVMYDRQTETWWQQIIGRGIIGEYAGETLDQFPSSLVSFENFAAAHPNGKVVNRETGHKRPYGRNPYRGYDAIDQSPFLFRGKLDPRLPPMERVMHINAGDEDKLYPFSVIKKAGVINDDLGTEAVVIFNRAGLLSVLDASKINASREVQAVTAFKRMLDDAVLEFEVKDGRLFDVQTGSEWNTLGQSIAGKHNGRVLAPAQSGIHFAFAWLAFNPDVALFSL